MEGAPTVEELSFYDQPDGDALFSIISPNLRQHQSSDDSDQEESPRRLRRSSSTSSIRSSLSTASTVSVASAASSTSSCSSVEQVFFGAQTDKEKKLVARLSRKAADSQIKTPPRASQRAGISNRLKKKDSLEFNRRKTLGFSSRRTVVGGQSRRWEGGLVESSECIQALGEFMTHNRSFQPIYRTQAHLYGMSCKCLRHMAPRTRTFHRAYQPLSPIRWMQHSVTIQTPPEAMRIWESQSSRTKVLRHLPQFGPPQHRREAWQNYPYMIVHSLRKIRPAASSSVWTAISKDIRTVKANRVMCWTRGLRYHCHCRCQLRLPHQKVSECLIQS